MLICDWPLDVRRRDLPQWKPQDPTEGSRPSNNLQSGTAESPERVHVPKRVEDGVSASPTPSSGPLFPLAHSLQPLISWFTERGRNVTPC